VRIKNKQRIIFDKLPEEFSIWDLKQEIMSYDEALGDYQSLHRAYTYVWQYENRYNWIESFGHKTKRKYRKVKT